MSLRINDIAPDFTAESTQGTIQFHDWIPSKPIRNSVAEFATMTAAITRSLMNIRFKNVIFYSYLRECSLNYLQKIMKNKFIL